MKKIMTFLSLILLVVACNKDNNTTPTTSTNTINIEIQEQYTTLPSKVSVFFKVTDSSGNPMPGLTEDNFTIYEKGRNDDKERLLSEDEANRIISDNAELFKYNIILLLDLSGSVLNNNLAELKIAANSFVDDAMATSNSSTFVGIWWFDGENMVHPLIDFTSDKEAVKESINSISPDISSDSSTDLFGAIIESTQIAESKLAFNEGQGYLSGVSIITFTDGTDQAARHSKQEAYQAVGTASDRINYYTIGLGNEIDETVLDKLGKTSFVYADNTDELAQKFEEIAQLIYNEANSYYLFEYCTPKRDGSGISDLHIVIETATDQGRRITSFDATGFSDDCELN